MWLGINVHKCLLPQLQPISVLTIPICFRQHRRNFCCLQAPLVAANAETVTGNGMGGLACLTGYPAALSCGSRDLQHYLLQSTYNSSSLYPASTHTRCAYRARQETLLPRLSKRVLFSSTLHHAVVYCRYLHILVTLQHLTDPVKSTLLVGGSVLATVGFAIFRSQLPAALLNLCIA